MCGFKKKPCQERSGTERKEQELMYQDLKQPANLEQEQERKVSRKVSNIWFLQNKPDYYGREHLTVTNVCKKNYCPIIKEQL